MSFADSSGKPATCIHMDEYGCLKDYIEFVIEYTKEGDAFRDPLKTCLEMIERRDDIKAIRDNVEKVTDEMLEDPSVFIEASMDRHEIDIPDEPRTGFDFIRAERMHKVLHRYQREKGEAMPTNMDDLESLLVDVLADLRHWAAGVDLYDMSGGALDFDLAARVSKTHFEAEVSEG